MFLKGGFEVNASREAVWNRIIDPAIMAGCIPGCESIEQINSTAYKAIVAVGIGVIRARFNLTVEILKELPPNEVLSRTSGYEGSRASTVTANNRVQLIELDSNNTRVEYQSEISLSGRLGKFGLGIMQKYVEGIGNEFADSFRLAVSGEPGSSVSKGDRSHPKTTKMASFLKRFGFGETEAPNDIRAENKSDRDDNIVASPLTRPSKKSAVLHPESVGKAVELLGQYAGGFPLAGGATLIAMKNAGLVQPEKFISLEKIESLSGISFNSDDSIRIGAMTRHYQTAESAMLTGTLAVVRQAAGSIANVPVRNMGTMGGALANADPAADYLAALVCVDARVELEGPDGQRTVEIGEFLVDWYETVLKPAEIITAVLLPPAKPGFSKYRKIARVSGDYAIASCAISVAESDQTPTVNLAVGGCGPYPIRDKSAEQDMNSQWHDPVQVDRFSSQLQSLADPIGDVRGSAEYRLKLIPRLIKDAISKIPEMSRI
ncbi:MAG: CO/xanthine dehydrogenase FAD-binding subunit/carbon monoxide dehydrogenase subunit G [Gammaproteobacteria bacterium]